MDVSRWSRELLQLLTTYGTEVRPVSFDSTGSWSDLGVEFTASDFTVKGRYPSTYPHDPPRFLIDPKPKSSHYYEDTKGWHLCYLRRGEWRPHYTMATAVGIVLRFLAEYRQGRTG